MPGSAPSVVRTSLEIASDAAAEWLPQETILFDRCSLERRLVVDMAAGAWFLGVEMLVFGRAAMGERVVSARLRDLIQVRRGGSLLLHDAIRLDGEVDRVMQRTAIAGGARAVATLVHVAPDADHAHAQTRRACRDTRTNGPEADDKDEQKEKKKDKDIYCKGGWNWIPRRGSFWRS